MHIFARIYMSPSALLRRATVYNHMGNFQMAAEDLRMVLMEEPQNTAATVSHGRSHVITYSCMFSTTRCHRNCEKSATELLLLLLHHDTMCNLL